MKALRLTAAGRGALTVVSLGPDPSSILLGSRSGRTIRPWPRPGRVTSGWLWAGGRALDEVVAVGTGEGVELHLHGGSAVLAALEDALGAGGIRAAPAEPPPASLREARARLSARCGPLADLVVAARGALERGRLDPALADRLRASLAREGLAMRLRRAPVVRLAGLPNAGKSTLFNALLTAERSLTSPIAGTTRDTVRARLVLAGLPVVLEDTAGGTPRAEGADLLVYLVSPGEGASPAVARAGPSVVSVAGQADRLSDPPQGAVSGLTGAGVHGLAAEIARRLQLSATPEDDALAPVDDHATALFREALDLLG